MSAILQHKSTQGGSGLNVTLSSNVQKGSLLVVGITDVSGEETSLSPTIISDTLGCTWVRAVQQNDNPSNASVAGIFYAIAPSSGSLKVTVTNLQLGFTALHVYEVSGGYNTLDQTGAIGWTGSFQNSFAVSTVGATSVADEFVFALFQCGTANSGDQTWTGEANEGSEYTNANNGSPTTFSEGFEITSAGVVTATASLTGSQDVTLEALIATFYKTTPAITTTSLPNGTIGQAYSQTLGAVGGTTPYTWGITGGALPNGLSLNASTGVVSGTPTVGGNYSITVQVTDSASPAGTATQSLALDVVAPGPAAGGWDEYQRVLQQSQRPTPQPPRDWRNPVRRK